MIRLAFAVALLATAVTPAAAHAQEALFDAPAMTDADLAEQRGGFDIPGGITVALGATITTDVNGQRLLQTVMQVLPTGPVATVQTAGGVTTIDARNATVTATLPDLVVQHFVGDRIGSMVANAGDNRVIDTKVQVDLSLGNVSPMALGSTVFRVQALGIDAGILRATGG